jgi:uncharacterized membrane protein YesL
MVVNTKFSKSIIKVKHGINIIGIFIQKLFIVLIYSLFVLFSINIFINFEINLFNYIKAIAFYFIIMDVADYIHKIIKEYNK